MAECLTLRQIVPKRNDTIWSSGYIIYWMLQDTNYSLYITVYKLFTGCCSVQIIYWMLQCTDYLLDVAVYRLFTGCCSACIIYWLLQCTKGLKHEVDGDAV